MAHRAYWDYALGSKRNRVIAAKTMKKFYPMLANPIGVTSTTRKLKAQKFLGVSERMGTLYASGAISVP